MEGVQEFHIGHSHIGHCSCPVFRVLVYATLRARSVMPERVGNSTEHFLANTKLSTNYVAGNSYDITERALKVAEVLKVIENRC